MKKAFASKRIIPLIILQFFPLIALGLSIALRSFVDVDMYIYLGDLIFWNLIGEWSMTAASLGELMLLASQVYLLPVFVLTAVFSENAKQHGLLVLIRAGVTVLSFLILNRYYFQGFNKSDQDFFSAVTLNIIVFIVTCDAAVLCAKKRRELLNRWNVVSTKDDKLIPYPDGNTVKLINGLPYVINIVLPVVVFASVFLYCPSFESLFLRLYLFVSVILAAVVTNSILARKRSQLLIFHTITFLIFLHFILVAVMINRTAAYLYVLLTVTAAQGISIAARLLYDRIMKRA